MRLVATVLDSGDNDSTVALCFVKQQTEKERGVHALSKTLKEQFMK